MISMKTETNTASRKTLTTTKPPLKDRYLPFKGHVFSLVQPLLDLTMHVPCSYLDQYSLLPNNGVLATEDHEGIFRDIMERGNEFGVEYSPGGMAQNSMRVLEWVLKGQQATCVVGCVGNDSTGTNMMNLMSSDGVSTHYETSNDVATGKCAVLVTPGNHRSMVTQLGASRHITLNYLLSAPIWRLVDQSRILYVTGFLLNDSKDCVMELGRHAAVENKRFVFNLSAPYISAVFPEECRIAIELSDIVMGNSDEVRALAKNLKLVSSPCDDIQAMIRAIAALPRVNKKRDRMVVITQGPKDILVFRNGQMRVYPVRHIPQSEIVDTTGAGDAFVGGFLAELVQGCGVNVCVERGIEAAHLVLRHLGCTLPSAPPSEIAAKSLPSLSEEKNCSDSFADSNIIDEKRGKKLSNAENKVVTHGTF